MKRSVQLFLKFHLQKIAAEDYNWKNAREPSALNIMFEDCGRSEIQHLTSSVKSLVKCYIYYVMTVQFFTVWKDL